VNGVFPSANILMNPAVIVFTEKRPWCRVRAQDGVIEANVGGCQRSDRCNAREMTVTARGEVGRGSEKGAACAYHLGPSGNEI
jgi:hypothetical protein